MTYDIMVMYMYTHIDTYIGPNHKVLKPPLIYLGEAVRDGGDKYTVKGAGS